MAKTQWTADSGDWNVASNWGSGVPGAGDDAAFAQLPDHDTVTGDGAAASISATGTGDVLPEVTFTGAHATGSLLAQGAAVLLGSTAVLTAQSVTIESVASQFGTSTTGTGPALSSNTAGVLQLAQGAVLATGTITLKGGELHAPAGVLTNPVFVSVSDFTTVPAQFGQQGALPGVIDGYGTLSGLLSGPGMLQLGEGGLPPQGSPSNDVTFSPVASYLLSDAADSLPGGLRFASVGVTLTGGQRVGAVLASSGTLALGAGAVAGPITAGTGGLTEIDATDQDLTVFGGAGEVVLRNGRGHATVVGAVTPGQTTPVEESNTQFGTLSVTGGTGAVTVFGGGSAGAIFGGTAGGNVIVAGADLSPFRATMAGVGTGYFNGPGLLGYGPVTIGGGGEGDLLVVTGTLGNVVAAAGGNETLTGAGASGNNVLFGGTGADVIVAGSGRDLVVAGSGSATISGGAGGSAILAGTGSDVILGGAGATYVQAGAGSATLFTGAGADLVGVVAGQAGGSLLVSGFRVGTDLIAARGYAAAPSVVSAGGNTVLEFSDRTRVTLAGVASLPGASFV